MPVAHPGEARLLLLIACSCRVALITFAARSGFGLYLEPMTSSERAVVRLQPMPV